MPAKNAEILGLEALAWLAGEVNALERFFTASGVDVANLRAAADHPETIAAILDFLLSNEDLLLAFCEHAAISSKEVHLARWRLESRG